MGVLVLVGGGAIFFLNNSQPPPATYTLVVAVTDASSSTPLASASVTVAGTAKTTDAAGVASFTLTSGSYTVAISKTGYAPRSESVQVSANMNLARSLTPNAPPTYTVSLIVTDSSNSSPLAGASATLGSVTKTTDSAGVASFTSQAGTFTLSISKAGYGSSSESIVVSGAASISRSLTPSPPPSYTVSVTVTNSSSSAPIGGATVTLNGAAKTTDPAGAASFNVPAGTYTLAIASPGFVSRSESITVSGDEALSRSLTPTPPTTPVTATFSFDSGQPTPTLGMATPFNQTSNGVTARFSSPSDPAAFSLQDQTTTGFTLPGFSGKFIYQNQVARTFLDIRFDREVTNITVTFSAVEYHDPFGQPTPIKVTAYLDSTSSTPVGSVTKSGSDVGGSYAVGTITFSSGGQPFNVVRVELPFLAAGATAFLVDNVVVHTR